MERFQTKKSLGQHFLNDVRIAERIAAEGEIVPGETVLEIGPGTGFLTVELLKAGARVVAVEADIRAIEELQVRFAAEIAQDRLTIHHNDIRELHFKELGLTDHGFKVIANIPYYISGLLFRLCLDGDMQPSRVVFLVQKEVAERITRSKKESLLSIGVKIYSNPSYAFTVKRGSFTPSPKVDSAVVTMKDVSRNRLEGLTEEAFFSVVHAGFASRRKQLYGCLRETYSNEALDTAFHTLSLSRKIRGEDLSLEVWVALTKLLTLST
jgi:16S rRNA (adenine1518-N6/adenine1519-N6)-dimethyltransferase